MSASRWTILSMLLLGAACAGAADLDAPVKPQQPTVRSEIYRGRTAHETCMDRFSSSAAAVDRCATDAIAKAVEANTATDPFILGVHLTSWLSLDIFADVYRDSAATASARRQFQQFDSMRTKLGIDDAAACQAAQLMCENVTPAMVRARGAAK